jgi:hypothetical protein
MDVSLDMEDHQPSTLDGSNADNLNEVSFEDNERSIDGHCSVDEQINQRSEQELEMEAKLREEREKLTNDVAAKFQSALNDIKITTKKLMSEMEHMMMVNEGVTIDYMKVVDSQQAETRRLEEAEPDVMNLTTKIQQAIETGNLSNLINMNT